MPVVIDADSHITEPADVWTARAPAKYAEDVPRVVRLDDGRDVWTLGGLQIDTVGVSAPAGFSGYPPAYPPTFADCHPAAADPSERLKYMDSAGIWAQVLYPNVAGFGSQRFLLMADEKLRLVCVRVYNDFLHEWTSVNSGRLIANISLPFWDVQASVAEIDRCLAFGTFRGILFTGEPQRFGLPPLGSHHWDPLYERAQDAGLPVHFHIGGGEDMPASDIKSRADRVASHGWAAQATYGAVNLFLKNGVQCADLITSGVLNRFPDLKFVSVESGIGWVPFMLETADYTWLGATQPGRRRTSDLLPSELFARQVFTTCWFEEVAPRRLIEDVPVDNIMFETDFPHTACLYGDIEERIDRGLGHLAEEVRQKILWGNAAKLYNIVRPDSANVTLGSRAAGPADGTTSWSANGDPAASPSSVALTS